MQTCDARATGQLSTRAHNLRRSNRNTPINKAISAVIITALVVTGLSIIGLVGTAGTAEAATARPAPPQEVVDAISTHFPPSQLSNALAVTYCESRWLTNQRTAGATKPNVGIFQINRVHRKRLAAEGYTWDDVRLNLDTNAKVAADLWRTQGWRPWTCKKALPTKLRRVMPTQEELLWIPPSQEQPAEPAPAEPAKPAEVAPPPAEPVAVAPPVAAPGTPPVATEPPAPVTPPIGATPPAVVDPIGVVPMPITPPPLLQSLLPPLLPPAVTDPGTSPVIGDPLVVAPTAAAPILAMFSAEHRVIPIKRSTATVPSLSTRIRIQTNVSL